MDCPACEVALERAEYEEAVVFQCPQCSGYLVPKRRLFLIKSSRQQTPEMLEQEAASQRRPESDERVRCPRCRQYRMRKQRVRIGDEGEFQLDVCEDCDHVWFDGGELARYQISYESSLKGQEAERMGRRRRLRTPEQRAEAKERMEAMPRGPSFLVHGFQETALLAVLAVLLVLVIASWFFGHPLLSGMASLPLAGLLGWLLMQVLHTSRSQIAALIVLAAMEIAYVCHLTLGY